MIHLRKKLSIFTKINITRVIVFNLVFQSFVFRVNDLNNWTVCFIGSRIVITRCSPRLQNLEDWKIRERIQNNMLLK